ncbi:MAG TPA: acyl-CoA dehydrogenase family protein [Thermoanaerobaculia bacterium]|nr:acyl-CoA dehydrogenase family protein [Thermoanaerobaculia bacterium]
MPDTALVRAFLDDRHLALATEVEAFAARAVAPLPPPADDAAARRQARQLLALLGAEGWLGYAVPAAWGGRWPETDLRACCLLREALAAASPLADAVFALQCLGSMPLALAGSEAQRGRWLPEIAAGRAMAAFAMTEPEAGSDVSAMATRARRARHEDDGYVLDGRKVFISNAGIADLYTVFASTSPEDGRRGLSCFLVAAGSPGLSFVGPQILSSPHPLGEIAFAECRVATGDRVGEEGEGFSLGMRTLDRLRPTVAAAACGMAARALAEATAHALARRQFGRALADFQITQQKLAVMATDLAAARLLVYRAAWQGDTQGAGSERASVPAAMAKAFATEAAQRIVDAALQILGGRGALADHPVERLYRSVRALRIYEGTTEIQHLIIARHLLKEGAAKPADAPA